MKTRLGAAPTGLRPEVIAAQARRLGLRAVTGRCTWQTYNTAFSSALETLAADAVTHVIFGDILSTSIAGGPEEMCEVSGLTAVEPLFGMRRP